MEELWLSREFWLQFWSNLWSNFATEIIVGLGTAFVTYVFTASHAEKRCKIKREAAITKFSKLLGEQIARVSKFEVGENAQNGIPVYKLYGNIRDEELLVIADSIVSTRDQFQGQLRALGNLLNKEIDELKTEVDVLKRDRRNIEQRGKVLHILRKLKENWRGKSASIEVAIDELLTELGLDC